MNFEVWSNGKEHLILEPYKDRDWYYTIKQGSNTRWISGWSRYQLINKGYRRV